MGLDCEITVKNKDGKIIHRIDWHKQRDLCDWLCANTENEEEDPPDFRHTAQIDNDKAIELLDHIRRERDKWDGRLSQAWELVGKLLNDENKAEFYAGN